MFAAFRTIASVATLLALAFLSPAAFGGGGGKDDAKSETREMHVDHADQKPLRVKTENGGISVAPSAASAKQDVSITAKVRAQTEERLKATAIVATRMPDGTLDVHVKWPDDKRRDNEGVSFEITLPNIHNAELMTANGPINLRHCDGSVHASTSNGPVSIADSAGDIIAKTSNGPITIADSAGPVRADTSNGPIDIALRSASTGPVHADTSNGGITLTVGPSFSGKLAAGTSNGRIGVEAPSAKVSHEKASTKVEFAAAGPESELKTSNGQIKITQH
jgi:DUF4097 and DUF4098 domain-containing protein YvlB